MIKILNNQRNLDKKFVRKSTGVIEGGDKHSEEEEEKQENPFKLPEAII